MITSTGKPMIELLRLHRVFGDTHAVNDVSFEVYQGEVFGYIGPNGAGKTTSMRILATLDIPSAGDARIDGFSVVNDPDRVRRRLGFMPDYFGTYHHVDCIEYLDFFARAYGLTGAARRAAIEKVMSFTGLDVLAYKPIRGFSKGMKQRLCLGRALIHDPSVLILDEPAAGLDPRARIELRRMIRALANDGKTILVSSHILTELAEICDRIGIIERGELLAVGRVDEIRKQLAAAQGHTFEFSVRVDGGGAPLARWLEPRPGVGQMVLDGENVRFHYDVDDEGAAGKLLREMVLADFPISEFYRHEVSLEDVFLHVTQGRVQ